MKNARAMQDITPVLMDANPCEVASVAVEPGGYVTSKSRFPVSIPGQLKAAYGYLAEHGVGIELAKESDETPFWSARAQLDPSYNVTALSEFSDPEGVELTTDDSLVLTASYQNASDHWLNNVPAAAIIYIAPSANYSHEKASRAALSSKTSDKAADVQSLLLQ